MVRLRGIIDEHHSICVFLYSRPALLISEVSRNVPQLQVQLAEGSHAGRWVSLQVNDSRKAVSVAVVAYLHPIVGR